jgi:hypothetical protein
VFIASVNDTGGHIIISFVENDDKALFRIFIKFVTLVVNLSPVTTTPTITYRQCHQTVAMKHLQQNQLAYTPK